MASKSKKAKKAKALELSLASAPAVVKPLKDMGALLHTCRTCGAEESHFKELDMALDAAFNGRVMTVFDASTLSSFTTFVGYQALIDLSQSALIRLCIHTRTDELFREWITFDGEDAEKIKKIEREFERLKIRQTLRDAVNTCGFLGGAYVYIDDGSEPNNRVNPLMVSDRSAALTDPNRPLRFKNIEPVYTCPAAYESSDPTARNFFAPDVILIQGTPVHASRLIRIVENEVPTLLRPSYNFLGLPQAQLLSNYVTGFRRNREETNRLLRKFSTTFVKANLKGVLYQRKPAQGLADRIELMARHRNNDGIALVDKETEDIAQINTPLAGVTEITRQSLEHVVAINQTGVVRTLGVSPAGFSATGESDLRMQSDLVATRQEILLREPIEKILKIVQLRLFKQIDETITFSFVPTIHEDRRVQAETRKIETDRLAVLLDRNAISPDEVREFLRKDEDSGLADLEGDAPDVDEVDFGQMTDPLGKAFGEGDGDAN